MREKYLMRRKVAEPKHHRGSDPQTPPQEVRSVGSPTHGKTAVASPWLDASKAAFPKETSPRCVAKSAAALATVQSCTHVLYVPAEAEHAAKTANSAVF